VLARAFVVKEHVNKMMAAVNKLQVGVMGEFHCMTQIILWHANKSLANDVRNPSGSARQVNGPRATCTPSYPPVLDPFLFGPCMPEGLSPSCGVLQAFSRDFLVRLRIFKTKLALTLKIQSWYRGYR
jgi:hypothetical protein